MQPCQPSLLQLSIFLAAVAHPKLMTAAATGSMAYCRANISSAPEARERLAGSLPAVLIVTFRLTIPHQHATRQFQSLSAAVTKPRASTSSTKRLRATHLAVLFWVTFPQAESMAQLRSCSRTRALLLSRQLVSRSPPSSDVRLALMESRMANTICLPAICQAQLRMHSLE